MSQIITSNGSIRTNAALSIAASQSISSKIGTDLVTFITGSATGYRMGINSGTPGYTLDVGGTANIANTLTMNGVTFVDVSRNISASNISASGNVIATSFTGAFSGSINDALSASYSKTSSLSTNLSGGYVTASGVYVSGALYVGGDNIIAGNLTVLGTSSILSVTSSQVNIGTNKITVNAYSPFSRYAGLSAVDSGSGTGVTSSLFWDSLNNYWLFQGDAASQGAIQSSSVMIGGPVGSLGSETLLTANTIPKATTGVNIGNSLLTDNGSVLIYSGTSGISGSAVTASNLVISNNIITSTLSASTSISASTSYTQNNLYAGNITVNTTGAISGAQNIIALNITGVLGVSGANVYAGNATIAGGTINNTTIGATTPSTGIFTTLTGTTISASTAITGAAGYIVGTLGAATLSASSAITGAAANIVNNLTAGSITTTGAISGASNVVVTAITGAFSGSSMSTGNATINGGAINNTTIGATTPSTGIFTTLTVNNLLSASGGITSSGTRVAGNETITGYLTVGNITSSGILSGSTQIIAGQITGAFSGSFAGTISGTASWASNAVNSLSASYLSGSTAIVNNLTAVNGAQIGGMSGGSPSQTAVQIGYNLGTGNSILNAVQIGYGAGNNSTNAGSAVQIGDQVGQNSITASGAVQIGAAAGRSATDATRATQVGFQAGYNAASGSYTTFIGSNADTLSSLLQVSKSIAIGYNAKVSGSNMAVIGGTGVDAVKVGIGTNNPVNTLEVVGNVSASSFTGSVFGTSSWANTSSVAISSSYALSSSYATTASYLPIGTYLITSSWATNALTASYLPVGTYLITSSWAQSSSNAINAITASYLPVGTYQVTSSWATNALTAGFLPVGTYLITSSWATNALTASFLPAATYLITSSWAQSSSNAISSSYAKTASYAGTFTASIGINTDVINSIGTALTVNTNRIALTNSTFNVAIGIDAGKVSISNYNVYLGYQAGAGVGTGTGADNNVFIGDFAGSGAIAAYNNNFIGFEAGKVGNNVISSNFIGYRAGLNTTSANDCIFIGSQADVAGSINPSKSVAIGYNAKVSGSNMAVIGGIGADAVKVGIGTYNPVNTLEVVGNVSASSFTGSFSGTSTNAISASYLSGANQAYVTGLTASSITVTNIYGGAFSGSIQSANVIITGGTINSTPIGTTTAAAGIFTTLTANNLLSASGGITSSGTRVAGNEVITGNLTIGTIIGNGSTNILSGAASIVATSITGSLTGSLTGTLVGLATSASYVSGSVTGSVYGTSSWSNNAVSSSYALSSSYGLSSSFAMTASYALASSTAFINNGNSFGATATLGTNDVNNLVFETNNVTRLTLDTNSGITASAVIVPNADNTYTLGSSAYRFSDFFAVQSTIGALFETGLRTEEVYKLQTGTILIWRDGKLLPCDEEFDEMVMGVVQQGKNEPIVFGAEPILVTGIVNEGDYIVTSNKKGHGLAIPRGSIHPLELFSKVIAQALEGGNDESCLIRAMIRKM